MTFHPRAAGAVVLQQQILVCRWIIARCKGDGRFRRRPGETLLIDARKLGTLIDRVHRELADGDIRTITETYLAWHGDKSTKTKNEDVPGFCKSATLDDIRHHSHILTPERDVGSAEVQDDGNCSTTRWPASLPNSASKPNSPPNSTS